MRFLAALQEILPRAPLTNLFEEVTILGWPARDGSDTMVLSTITTERGTTVILEEVRQRRARENLPDVTIRRE